MKIKDIDQALADVRKNLESLLIETGVISTEKSVAGQYFLCPNPKHIEKTPSAHVLTNKVKGFCHGCQATFDILTLNHWKNNAPISGPGFITNNLLPLCTKYGVPFELGDLTEEDKFRIDSYHACRMVVDYIVAQPWSEELQQYVESRGLTVDWCKQNDIGVVANYEHFEAFLKDNFTTVFLRTASLLRPGLFGSKNIIFTIKDPNGAPIGFIARDTGWEAKRAAWEEKGCSGAPPRKYDSSSEGNGIYFKSQNLYGFHSYVENKHENTTLYIVEGQFDVELMKFSGILNASGLSGSAFTPQQIALLRKHGVTELIMVLDGDKQGRKALNKLLLGDKGAPGMLTSASFCKKLVLELPDDHDPNSYIKTFGIDAFKALQPIDAFSWALRNQEPDVGTIEVCDMMIPFILSDPNFIQREEMIRILSEFTGSSIKAIQDEVARREDVSVAQIEKEKDAILQDALREAQFNANDGSREQILQNALSRMEEIDRSKTTNPLSTEEIIHALDAQILKESSLEGPSGLRFAKLWNLEATLAGEVAGTVLAFGGVPNTGKSALFSQISKEVVVCNPDVIGLVFTIDDDRVQMNRRLALQFAIDEAKSIGSNLVESLSLNKFANPKYYIEKDPDEHRDLLFLRDFGYSKLRDLYKSGRLYVKDMTHGVTISFLEKMVKKARKDFPDEKIVAILDNFHKAQDFPNQEERIATKKKSSMLKTNIAQAYGVTVFSTFEYKKVETGKRPTNSDLRETVNLEYDINYLEHLFSPLKAAKDLGEEEKCLAWHGNKYNKLPIVDGSVGKNKVSEATPMHFYKFFPHQSRFEAISPAEKNLIEDNNRIDQGRSEGRTVVWSAGKKIEVPSTSEQMSLVANSLKEIPF